MELGTISLADLQRMKEEMDRVWLTLFEESATPKEGELWQWVEKLPKFEGTGRRSLNSRSNKTVKY
jgi:hypothetical protein